MALRVLDLDPATYKRHALHGDSIAWVEKNCYFDIWVEMLHALGCEPFAMVPVVVAIDFLDDQWTFFKPSHTELWELYGVDVQEMNCWRPLIEQAVEHLAAGRLISTEADAWWLPDVSGTDYRRHHTKSTIVLTELDVESRTLGYFHNAGYYRLEGEDFIKTFRLDQPHDPAFMPFYAETVALSRLVRRRDSELRALSGTMLARHLARRPQDNPVARFAKRFARDLPVLQDKGIAYYHQWAFATVRQLGASAEVMAHYLRWLAGADAAQFAPAVAAYDALSSSAKLFILKAARTVAAKRTFDAQPMFDEWCTLWERAIVNLEQHAD